MFGTNKIPFKIATERFFLETEIRKKGISYLRTLDGTKTEKLIFGVQKSVLIIPVEPVNTPKEIARHLMIHFDVPLLLEPKGQADVFLTFPLEIGLFVEKKDTQLIDIFGLVQPRFTLYGDPHSGVLCRYWKSQVLDQSGLYRPFEEGILRLRVKNLSGDWAGMSRVIVDAVSMKIYYKGDLVGLEVNANILNSSTAEVWCPDSPLKEGMHKSNELFEAKKLTLAEHKFIMREGL